MGGDGNVRNTAVDGMRGGMPVGYDGSVTHLEDIPMSTN